MYLWPHPAWIKFQRTGRTRFAPESTGLNTNPSFFALTNIVTQGAAEELLTKAKQMQCKALRSFPVICIPHTRWRGFRGSPRPSLKATPWAKHAAPLISYIKIPPRSTTGLKAQDPGCTQCLAPLVATAGPKHRRCRPAASPGATRRSSAQGIPPWAALHFLWG